MNPETQQTWKYSNAMQQIVIFIKEFIFCGDGDFDMTRRGENGKFATA